MDPMRCARHLLGAVVLVMPVVTGCGTSSAPPSTGEAPAPSASEYGSTAARRTIQEAMLSGTASDVIAAIDSVKALRGTWMGCPTKAVTRQAMDTTPGTSAEVHAVWESIHAPGIAAATIDRPSIGRDYGRIALGGWYAKRAGAVVSVAHLAAYASNLRDQQCTVGTCADAGAMPRGLFGYVLVPAGDPWYLGSLVGGSALTIAQRYPALAATYTGGAFAGSRFLIGDTLVAQNFVDGGAAYDHGIAGVMMNEAATTHPDATVRTACRASANSAADWAVSEPCVSNHNYTAKLVWLLAATYAATGDATYRDGCVDKLRRDVLPGVLMDRDGDGRVDGVPGIAFSQLTTSARVPGRMWDGHNSLPWYHAMNTHAVVAAYAALRDRGDAALADDEVRPYAIAMLDNLAWEVEHLGLKGSGFADVPPALLTGIWSIARAENEAHPAWDRAAWAMWNAGRDRGLGDFTLAVGLYLMVVDSLPYAPLTVTDARPSSSASAAAVPRYARRP